MGKSSTSATTGARSGRLPAADVPARRDSVLDAAMSELLVQGYEATTMLSVARRAGASKETLYSWFGNKEGLFGAMIERNAQRTDNRVETAMTAGSSPTEVLVEFALNLQRLLLGEASIAINRLAMRSPELSAILLEHGRVRTGRLVERFLAQLMTNGVIREMPPDEAFTLLYGLVIEDRQIRCLLGEPKPTDAAMAVHASDAVGRFLGLVRVGL